LKKGKIPRIGRRGIEAYRGERGKFAVRMRNSQRAVQRKIGCLRVAQGKRRKPEESASFDPKREIGI